MTTKEPAGTSGGRDSSADDSSILAMLDPQVVAALAAVSASWGTGSRNVGVDLPDAPPSTGDVLTLHGGQNTTAQIRVVEHLTDQLDLLSRIGQAAGQVYAILSEQRREAREQQREHDRAARLAEYVHGGPEVFGLTASATDAPREAGENWSVPGHPEVLIVRVTEVGYRWNGAPDAVHLHVSIHGLEVGIVAVDVDGALRVEGRHATDRVDADLVGRERQRDLADANPWNALQFGKPATVPAAIEALAGVYDQVAPWVQDMDAAVAEAAQLRAERDAEAKEWARLSRAKDRIPSAALNKFLDWASNVTHDSTGYPTGGWRVVAEQVVGRTRPRHLDGSGHGSIRRSGRTKPVGVKEILYVARLVHTDHHRRGRTPHLRFNDLDVAKLRELMPECVVRMPEDRGAIFVAVDAPEHVQALEAAVVEWVLLGPDAE